MSNSLMTKVLNDFNNPKFTEEQLDFLMNKFPACMGHLMIVVMKNHTTKEGYNWKDFYEDDSPRREGDD